MTIEEVQQVGERRINLMRAFNAREGAGRDQDILPKKLAQPLKGGASDGFFVSQEELDVYYELAGWNKTSGNPQKEKLIELGLE